MSFNPCVNILYCTVDKPVCCPRSFLFKPELTRTFTGNPKHFGVRDEIRQRFHAFLRKRSKSMDSRSFLYVFSLNYSFQSYEYRCFDDIGTFRSSAGSHRQFFMFHPHQQPRPLKKRMRFVPSRVPCSTNLCIPTHIREMLPMLRLPAPLRERLRRPIAKIAFRSVPSLMLICCSLFLSDHAPGPLPQRANF